MYVFVMKPSDSATLLLLVIVLCDVVAMTSGANILVSLFLPTYSSHTKGMSSIAGALTIHGHNVTILTNKVPGTRGFQRNTYNRAIHYGNPLAKDGLDVSTVFDSGFLSQLMTLYAALDSTREDCVYFFEDSNAISLLKSSSFDILIGDVFSGCDALLSRFLGLRLIAITTSPRYPFFHEHLLRTPAPSSYVPFGIFPWTDRMSFLERVANFLEHNVAIKLMEMMHFGALNELKDKLEIAPGESIQDILRGVELWMSMTNFALDYPRAIAPNWVPIANIADRTAKPLQKEYEDFIAGAGKHGFILFSLGSYVTEFPNPEMAEAFARVFSELPQRVIWRYTGTRPRNLGNNTMLTNWLPQNDLLGHPKIRLVIYHGGLTGVLEAVYHGVPMVIMPLYAEQSTNSKRVTTKGMGIQLEKDSITYETVKAALTEVLHNPSYNENAKRTSSIYRDSQSTADETVVFWVEHVLKFGGSHLRTRALELNFIQLNSIDVMVFIGGIVMVIVFLLFTCCKRALLWCLKSKKTKVE